MATSTITSMRGRHVFASLCPPNPRQNPLEKSSVFLFFFTPEEDGGTYFSQPEISYARSLEEEVRKSAIVVSAFGNTTYIFMRRVRFGACYSIIRSSGRSDVGTGRSKDVK